MCLDHLDLRRAYLRIAPKGVQLATHGPYTFQLPVMKFMAVYARLDLLGSALKRVYGPSRAINHRSTDFFMALRGSAVSFKISTPVAIQTWRQRCCPNLSSEPSCFAPRPPQQQSPGFGIVTQRPALWQGCTGAQQQAVCKACEQRIGGPKAVDSLQLRMARAPW